MDKITYENHKADFKHLTGKSAEENLEAFFSYLVMLSNIDINDKLKAIYTKLN
ncbi:MAG: hypothetical protein ACK5RV_12710 [Flavobacterium sp.]|jgi:hypothetical protein|uniref:hypothetical protein n=1 Tax=Flavobacterium sp. TaxID=239 RepID=UPI0022BE7555|nr:hypothetical protein [Flavobacterium sp.]MCZ8168196.1 hypothetical protein [Flavobacterium sp.]MCZ8297249.1 hypothetical protein [Flavobacterium sp.]